MSAIDDRQALNVRASAESLMNSYMTDVDRCLASGQDRMAEAKKYHAEAMRIMSGLVADDIAGLASILNEWERNHCAS